MPSEGPKRRFPPPWRVEQTDPENIRVVDANGITVARVPCRDDLQQWSFGHSYLSSDEARRIARGIARLPEFLMQRRGFHPRGPGTYRWRADRPYHVALADAYHRENWHDIDTLCKLNALPHNPTGEIIRDGGAWCVFEFAWQLDAVMFWAHFDGRWLRGSEFAYPERPAKLPEWTKLASYRFSKPRAER